MDQWDYPDRQEFLDLLDHKVCRVHSALQDPEVLRVVQVLQVFLDQRETWD